VNFIDPQQLAHLLPLAVNWAREQESYILQNGEPLTASQTDDARLVPVEHPEKVRLLSVDEIPSPDNPLLRTAAQITGLIPTNAIGLTLRYGIFMQSDYGQDRKLIVHELAHVAQYERCGGIAEFLKQYLLECITIGYPDAPMEQEAVSIANRICS
jgi:hypothetical protein